MTYKSLHHCKVCNKSVKHTGDRDRLSEGEYYIVVHGLYGLYYYR